jgi:DNA-binding LacI/PurR family transcriptional regulator
MVEGLPKRLADEFRQKIGLGEWAVGGRLPTTRELADAYRVSVNTIQTAFRELEADDLVQRRPGVGGFVKNRYPRSSTMRPLTTIGVVGAYSESQAHVIESLRTSPSASPDEWGYRIIQGLDWGLAPSGFNLTTFSYSNSDPDALRKVLDKIDRAGSTLAGLLCFMKDEGVEGLLEELDKRNLPWVTVNRPTENANHNFVTHDAFRGGRLIARCFARMGFERIAILSDALRWGNSAGDKYFGFLEGWIESGKLSRDADFVQCTSHVDQAGYEAFSKYVERFGPPRAVFAAGDFLALGAMRACRELGLAVPGQVDIIGSTGLRASEYSHPSLTVLDTPMEQMGGAAAQMLVEMAREGVRRMSGRYAKASLMIRESCAIPADLLAQEQAVIDEPSRRVVQSPTPQATESTSS